MIIISCSQARIVFVSDTIQDVLNEPPDNWMGTCFYDLLHPKDIQKVKEQLASFDLEEGTGSQSEFMFPVSIVAVGCVPSQCSSCWMCSQSVCCWMCPQSV